VKSVLRKILGLFEAHERFVVIDKSVLEIRLPSIRNRKFIDPMPPAVTNDIASVVVLVVS
jgi:hypothetical protein